MMLSSTEKAFFCMGTDVSAHTGPRRLDLILHGADQCAVSAFWPSIRKQKSKGSRLRDFISSVPGLAKSTCSLVVAAQILVDIEEAGALHHEGVDLLDGGIGVAALALPLSVGVDDAVQRLPAEGSGATIRLVLVLILDIVPQIHGQRQQDTGAGDRRSGRGDDDGTHGLFISYRSCEQVVHSVQQRGGCGRS